MSNQSIKDYNYYYSKGFRAALNEERKPKAPKDFESAVQRGWEDGLTKAVREELSH